MSSYKHKSGAQKRGEKEKRDKEAGKGSRTLFQVGVKKVTEEEGRQSEQTDDDDIQKSPPRSPELEGNYAGGKTDSEEETEGNVAIVDE